MVHRSSNLSPDLSPPTLDQAKASATGPTSRWKQQRGWKPHSLRPPLLSSVIIFMLGIIGLLEYFSMISRENQALVTTSSQFSPATTFVYLYLPTLLAVLFSLLWSWIDLDAKRLEPYFQMSKAGGATAEDSLDLHYPFDFVAWAPVKALRKW